MDNNSRHIMPSILLAQFVGTLCLTLSSLYEKSANNLVLSHSSNWNATLMVLTAILIGLFARPAGAILLGPIADKERIKGLSLSVAIVSISTLALAALPIGGILGNLWLLTCRFSQAFAFAVIFGSVGRILFEYTTRNNRTRHIALQISAQTLAVACASIVGYLASFIIPQTVINTWGWRSILIVAACIGLVVAKYVKSTQIHSPNLTQDVSLSLPSILKGSLFLLAPAASLLFLLHIPVIARSYLNLSASQSLMIAIFSLLVTSISAPASAQCTTIVGRHHFLIWSSICITLLTPICILLAIHGSWISVICSAFCMAILCGSVSAAAYNELARLLHPKIAATATGLCYGICLSTTWIISTYLLPWISHIIHIDSLGLWTILTGIISMLAAAFNGKVSPKEFVQNPLGKHA
jgi:MFS family permease